MTDEEMLEAEKYWCENCCNWDKEQVQIDGYANCKLTGTFAFAQESGKECKCFNVPAENVIVLPCKVGDVVYYIKEKAILRMPVKWFETNNYGWCACCVYPPMATFTFKFDDFGKTVFLTREEAEAALKGGGEDA